MVPVSLTKNKTTKRQQQKKKLKKKQNKTKQNTKNTSNTDWVGSFVISNSTNLPEVRRIVTKGDAWWTDLGVRPLTD